MESRQQNPEFRINPENFHPCITVITLTHTDFDLKKMRKIIFNYKIFLRNKVILQPPGRVLTGKFE